MASKIPNVCEFGGITKMTAKELATMLSGLEVGNEITSDEAWQAADAGLVVVLGYSDEGMVLGT